MPDRAEMKEVDIYKIDLRDMKKINIGLKSMIVSPECLARELCGFTSNIVEYKYTTGANGFFMLDIRVMGKHECKT